MMRISPPIYKGYILRLRATEQGIVDLAGSNIVNHNVTLSQSLIGEGSKSLNFNGNNAYLEYDDNHYIAEGLDFTISVWIGDSIARWTQTILKADNPYTALHASFFKENDCTVRIFLDGIEKIFAEYTSLPSTNPFHFALIRKNNVVRIAINGNFGSTIFDYGGTVLTGVSQKFIGHEPGTLSYKYFLGKMEDLCVIAGKALWTENFTPPTTYLPDYNEL